MTRKHPINQGNLSTNLDHILPNSDDTPRNQLTLIYSRYAPDTTHESNSPLPNIINNPSTEE